MAKNPNNTVWNEERQAYIPEALAAFIEKFNKKKGRCLEKQREHQKKYRNSAKGKVQQETYYKTTKVSKGVERALVSIRGRALKNDLHFNLTVEDLAVPEVCPVLGIPLKQWGENTGLQMDSPTVDRLNPKGGYTKDNIRVISWRANKIKSDATVEEIKAILAYMTGASAPDLTSLAEPDTK